MFDTIFPHILYLAPDNTDVFEKTCVLSEKILRNQKFFNNEYSNLTNGKVYKFRYTKYSPDRETPYREILVTKDDNNKYIRYEDDKTIWKYTKKIWKIK
jgi:lysine/ornithine N-monooxygenase